MHYRLLSVAALVASVNSLGVIDLLKIAGAGLQPAERRYKYTFDALAKTIMAFTDAPGLRRSVLYVFDYGARTGFRLSMARPERIAAIVSQNGNAYKEGLVANYRPSRCKILG